MQPFIVALVVALLFQMCFSVEFSQETYIVLAGLKIRNNYKATSFSYKSLSLCALNCLTERHVCKSANYNEITKSCELNLESPLEESVVVLEESDWQILYIQDDIWQLIFRGTAGIGVKTYPAYKGSIQLSEPEVACHLTQSLPCTTHYRSSIIDNWQSENIKQVKITLFKDGKMVVRLLFQNLNGDSNVGWFSKDRLINSSFTDLTDPQQYFNYFKIEGDTNNERRFYINQYYSTCPEDRGWMAVYDKAPACDYEKGYALPHFAYMPNNTIGLWENKDYQSADVLAIFVKKG